MASMEISGRGERRPRNHELPLVPFIDFLLCLVAFLLVTAVWSRMARLEADARTGGGSDPAPSAPALHVEMRGEETFRLTWRDGATVLSMTEVPRTVVKSGVEPRYPELARSISEEWSKHGSHRAKGDSSLDRAVLHTDNDAPFAEVAAVLDALHEPRREIARGETRATISAFDVTFAAN
jgi:biopolymer transport protein ExbD